MLSLRNVVVHYEGIEALKAVSVDAEQGRITTLIGANGAGKSTILRAISGLVPLASGEICFMGEKVDGMKPEEVVRKGITLVPEGRGLFPWMTVVDNLLTATFLRKDRYGIKADLERVYEYFPVLKRMSKRLAKNMSGGEQQMLALGRALLAHPSFYLLDEPSMGLAPLIVEEIMATITKMTTEENRGVLLVEQNAGLALRLAKRAYVLELGKIVLEGDARELLDDHEVRRAYMGM